MPRIFRLVCIGCLVVLPGWAAAQPPRDSSVEVGRKIITLSDVVVGKKTDVPQFISRIRSDSSFYKSFRNLRILGYTAVNDIRMLDKKGMPAATLHSITRQGRKDGCRTMEVLEETATGDIYDQKRHFNYYTADMYASLFFTRGRVCGETNVVGNTSLSLAGKSGMDKHREQLKLLFFNPGRRIPGLPFMSGKTEIFDDDLAAFYDMKLEYDDFRSRSCYVFIQKVKPGMEDRVVVNEMKTWFDESSMEVLARNYSLSYNAMFYDFNVEMQVEMGDYRGLRVPALIRYTGNWKVPFKRRERGVFTATLSDFRD